MRRAQIRPPPKPNSETRKKCLGEGAKRRRPGRLVGLHYRRSHLGMLLLMVQIWVVRVFVYQPVVPMPVRCSCRSIRYRVTTPAAISAAAAASGEVTGSPSLGTAKAPPINAK